MERKAAKGEWTHGPRPYGYLLDPDTSHLVPHPEEQDVVKEIFRLYADTKQGTRAIAEHLNALGKRTKHGKPFSGHTIVRMLANRLYLGEVGFRDVLVENAHDALVDEDLFERCQRILQARGEVGSSRAATNSDYQLTGLITCPECGHKFVGTSAMGKLRRYRYYTCFSRARYGPAGCGAHRIDADQLEEAMATALVEFFERTDLITAAVEAEREQRAQHTDRFRAELEAITGQIAATEAAVDRYLSAFETGEIDPKICGDRVRDLTLKIDQLKTRRGQLADLVSATPTPPTEDELNTTRATLAQIFKDGRVGQRKAFIEAHVAEIKIENARILPTFIIPAELCTQGLVVGRAGLEPATEGL